ncbi:hypothetical protein MASR1M97_33070 [Candidatus Desulfobacillus denitrificans]
MSAEAERSRHRDEGLRIVLADGDEAGAPLEIVGQGGERLEAAVEPLGLEAGADLHQQQVVASEVEFAAEP